MTAAELRELLVKAAPGPWEACGRYVRTPFDGHGGFLVADTTYSPLYATESASLIAAMYEALPALLDAADEREWRPIAEAPKDAPYWIVWSAYYERPVVVTQRMDDNTYWKGDWDFDVEATHYLANPAPPVAGGGES